ncbi:thiolase family protein [Aromatoleum aromaticum]|uniref:Beta-oxoacyl-CoA thiolase n=1 Tax=Aromatoleum aromaticum (strain DSM 19018 / LMG 30748 / EbN1) TaxID=76114 RepID=Q5P604_AROAE|nr:thiolase family protein [Aromatoleum aromaticum]NMG54290.1 thiolase family protein [Aromatoleum aromaticum]CAI07257.1 putative beta-oxoacyl-CoA thiolase [Aromatoleum aromaticum EbN1]
MSYKAEIPYGAYWSTPFARWQGSFANLHSVRFAAHVAREELGRRAIDPALFDYGVLGFSVPQQHAFYGLPWLTGMIGATRAGGPTMMQACATGVRTLLAAAQEIESDMASVALAINCDRTSNGPHLYYPNPRAPGGTGSAENWVMDNFGCDPLGGHSMLATAENVASKHNVTTAQQHELVLRREQQYGDALRDDSAFLRRFMTLPFAVPCADFRKTAATLDGDEGTSRSTADGLAKLRPVVDGGSVTFGAQTHPADGNAAIVVTTPDKARELSADPKIAIRLHGFGLARAELAYMPEAMIPAARRALDQAGRSIADLAAIKTHNPFAVNDIVFARETGADLALMNNYGCSLVWGHPQAPMGTRAIIELIEELALRGGGFGLFTGCAAGDTAMAVVIEVCDA